jgi:hypothetical protein
MLAKDAVRAVWKEKHGEPFFPADIETDDADGRVICSPRGAARAEPFPPVRVATAGGKLVALSAFAERIGLALTTVPKNASPEIEREVQARVACAAVADALGVPVETCALVALDASTGVVIVSAGTERFRVQTARLKDAIGATTLCEPA